MDVDTKLLYHRRIRSLQRQHPADWPAYLVAYLGLLGEAWSSLSRDVTLEDAWCPALQCDLDAARAALEGVGLVDDEGRVPEEAWGDWFGPVEERIARMSALGKAGAAKRYGVRHADGMPQASHGDAPHQPASQPATPASQWERRIAKTKERIAEVQA